MQVFIYLMSAIHEKYFGMYMRMIIVLMVVLLSEKLTAQFSNQAHASIIFSTPEVAMLGIDPPGSSNIILALQPLSEAGAGLKEAVVSNSDLWLNYTSSMALGKAPRSVNVQITSGVVPPGVQLKLRAMPYSGTKGAGTFGISTGEVNVTGTPSVILSGVGRSYTGTGKNGHQLNYRLEITDFGSLSLTQGANVQITYTLTDN